LILVCQAIVSDKSFASAEYPGHAEQVRKDASFRRPPADQYWLPIAQENPELGSLWPLASLLPPPPPTVRKRNLPLEYVTALSPTSRARWIFRRVRDDLIITI
jgi:hypothetical protein